MSSLKLKGMRRTGSVFCAAVGVAVALGAAPALAHSAASTRGGGGGSSSGHVSGHSSSGGSSHSSSSSHGGGGSSGVAVPRGGGSSSGSARSPHHSYGSGGHDDHYHGGGYYGGYWGGYYPWYGYGWGPYYGYGWGWGGGWWWPWGVSVGYNAYGAPPPYGGYYGGDGGYGALDLDVVPEQAQVWVDGQYAGTCDDFDGYPQYLWLPAGTHDIAIYAPGLVTITRQYSIYGGRVIEVNDHMQPGQSIRPEDLQPSESHDRRDERLRRNDEREADARQYDPNWREPQPGEKPDEDKTPRERREQRDAERESTANAPQARVHLIVEPSDASIYLDGTFLGLASQVTNVNGMTVPPGHHTLEVVRPGFDPEHVEFDSSVGHDVEVKVDLDKD